MTNGDNQHESEPCPSCGGSGCPVCKGTGVASERVGRWGRGHREESGGQSDFGGGTRLRWRRALVVVVGFAVLGALLSSVGVVDGPFSGVGLGVVVGLVVWGLAGLLG